MTEDLDRIEPTSSEWGFWKRVAVHVQTDSLPTDVVDATATLNSNEPSVNYD
jgi:hypothetical protein